MNIKKDRQPRWQRFTGGMLRIVWLFIASTLLWNWLIRDAQRQDKWILTAALGMATYAGFLLWVLLVSRWPARARWPIFVGTIVLIVFCRFGLRITGVTGDLVPVIDWRWKATRIVSVEKVDLARTDE